MIEGYGGDPIILKATNSVRRERKLTTIENMEKAGNKHKKSG